MTKTIYKILRKVFSKNKTRNVVCERDPNIASQKIYKLLTDNKPCMIARFGSTELTCIANYISVKKDKQSILGYIKGEVYPWWWEDSIITQMQQWSGFFPPEMDYIEKFCELMIKDAKEVNLLGSWLNEEKLFEKEINSNSKVQLSLLDPYWADEPWTRALKNKKILIIHPFKNTIEKQYEIREKLFENKDTLPEFKSLKVIRAVQSIAGNKTEFNTWFEALDSMKKEMDNSDYDICLISAGAYGFPLAAYAKRQGKKAIHMGGSLQLLFGIIGKRWEDPKYSKSFKYYKLMNKYWSRPSEHETPKKSALVENGCYW